MDRNAGGPSRWQEFYGRTAEKFFYNPELRPGELRITATVLRTNDPNARPLPAQQRPPQFDYIYHANDIAKAQAEADVAKLAGKVDALLARRRQLEAEQSALWCKIAFRAVAGRDLLSRPLYRFDLQAADAELTTTQQLDALRAAMEFLRINNNLVEFAEQSVEQNQAGFVTVFNETVAKSRSNFDASVMKQPTLILDAGDAKTTLGKLVAVSKRMRDVAKNVRDAFNLSLDGDKAGDEQRKQTFRLQLQDALITYAEAVIAGDECVNRLAADWKLTANLERAVEPPKAPELPPLSKSDSSPSDMTNTAEVTAKDDQVVIGAWRKVDSNTNFTFAEDGTFSAPNAKSAKLRTGRWQLVNGSAEISFANDPRKFALSFADANTLVGSDGFGEWRLTRIVNADDRKDAANKYDGFYWIVNEKAGKAIAITNANRGNGGLLKPRMKTSGQQWEIVPTVGGKVRLLNRLSNLCLGIRQGLYEPGVDAIIWTPADAPQRDEPHDSEWFIESVGNDGGVRFKNTRTSLYLAAGETAVIQAKKDDSTALIWRLEPSK